MTKKRLLGLLFVSLLPLAASADCMGPYPPSMVISFNSNCAKDPKLAAYCTCVMDEVQHTIPLADFIEVGNSAGGINEDPRFIKAGKKCTPLINNPQASVVPAGPKITKTQQQH